MKSDNVKPAAQADFAMLARVLVMPDAVELFEAFAGIPPGPLRQSVIQHAKVIRDTYAGAPPEMQMQDPLLTAAGVAQALPALPAAKKARMPKTDDPLTRAVMRRMEGEHPQQIAREMGLHRAQVEHAISEARKAGVHFPTLKGHPLTGRPLEEKTWAKTPEELSAQGFAVCTRAANKRGIDVAEYLRRKNMAVELALQGFGYDAISEKTGETDLKSISLWLSNARAAGIDVPYAARPTIHEAEFEPAPETNVVQVSRWFGPLASIPLKGRFMVEHAASARNMTPEAYLDLQESIVRQRLDGVSPSQIAKRVGQPERFVYDAMTLARKRGAKFPPLKFERSAANG